MKHQSKFRLASANLDNIHQFAYPLVEHIHTTEPNHIIVCDRGARLIGIATYALHRELYGNLPTLDKTMRFRRITGNVPYDQTKKYLAPLVDEILNSGGKDVLIIDHFMYQGKAMKTAKSAIKELSNDKLDVRFATAMTIEKLSNDVRNTQIPDFNTNITVAFEPEWEHLRGYLGVRYDNPLEPEVMKDRRTLIKTSRRQIFDYATYHASIIRNALHYASYF